MIDTVGDAIGSRTHTSSAEQADVNAQNVQGFTALHCATRYRFAKLRALLLQHGADDAIAASDGTTSAQIAEDSEHAPGSSPLA